MIVPRRQFVLVVVVCLMSFLAACGQSGDSEVSTGSSARPAASADPGAPRVELLDSGEEPREALRIHQEVGDRAHREMTMLMAMHMVVDGAEVPTASMPAVIMSVDTEVTDVDAQGVTTTEFAYDNVRLDGGGKDVRQLEKQLQTMNGVSGVLKSTDTGVVLDADLDVPPDMPSSMATMLRSLESQMANMSVPTPTEPVGPGARWTVTTKMEINGLEATNVYSYELVDRSAEGIGLELELEQSAPEQDPELPGMPAGTSAHLDHMHMSGSGRVLFDPNSLLPVSLRSSVTGNVQMTITDADDASSELLQELDVRVQMDAG